MSYDRMLKIESKKQIEENLSNLVMPPNEPQVKASEVSAKSEDKDDQNFIPPAEEDEKKDALLLENPALLTDLLEGDFKFQEKRGEEEEYGSLFV